MISFCNSIVFTISKLTFKKKDANALNFNEIGLKGVWPWVLEVLKSLKVE